VTQGLVDHSFHGAVQVLGVRQSFAPCCHPRNIKECFRPPAAHRWGSSEPSLAPVGVGVWFGCLLTIRGPGARHPPISAGAGRGPFSPLSFCAACRCGGWRWIAAGAPGQSGSAPAREAITAA